MDLKLKLPALSRVQGRVFNGDHRFRLICGGRESGKTTLAVEAALTGRGGLLSRGTVVFCEPDEMRAARTLRRLFHVLEPLVLGKPKGGVLALRCDATLRVISLEDDARGYYERPSLLVIDGADLVDGLAEIWTDVLLPSLGDRGTGWIFGKPSGTRSSFGRLYQAARADRAWAVTQLPSVANPRADKAAIASAKRGLSPDAYRQEYLGEVVEGAVELSVAQSLIGAEETFVDWCDRLAETGLKVDGIPFRLDDRPTMRWIYGLIPSTIEEAFGKRLVLMKCAQVGFTVLEMLAMLYFALKFAPAKIGMYLPDMKLAGLKSSERFMPIARTIPDAYRMMLDEVSGTRRGGEGNVLVRNMGGSRFHFLWTSGKAMTESVPLDVVSFDEVQEMTTGDMEKTSERMSASRVRYTLMGSTANWPDSDIHREYKRGRQWQFWTRCPGCGTHQILDDHFPACIRLVDEEYRYVCHACGGVINDAQAGEWRAAAPDAPFDSIHYPQFLSPTISPREIIEAYFNAEDLKNFFNRKRGKPYTDPSQVPVNLEMLNACARLGVSLGVVWKERASASFMGIDQMGAFNVCIIKERRADGRQALIHVELIYDDDPFARCDVLMDQYAVQCCVLEGLPNFNDAWRFAKRHPGRVFVAGYSDLSEEMLRWGDSRPSRMDRKTDEDSRVQYTVTLDQYKCMQASMARFALRTCLFPDAAGLVQEIREKGVRKRVAVLKDVVFEHFLHTALVAEKDPDQHKYRRRVVKIGLDPHASYANMLCDVAWARAHGTTSFILPSADPDPIASVRVAENMPGLPGAVLGMIAEVSGTCGVCVSFREGVCSERAFRVASGDPACDLYVST